MIQATQRALRGGFSLLELLAALTIGGLLLAMAVPGFTQQRAGAGVRAAVDQTLAALHLARRLALSRGQSITVCPSPDGMRCGFGGGEWILFANIDPGSDSRRETGEPILQRWELPSRVAVTGTRGYAAFQPMPGSATTLTFNFCHADAPALGRSIIVSQTGRPRVSRPDPASSSGQSSRCH